MTDSVTARLVVEGLEVRIGTTRVLRGVNMEVHRGEIVALIGRNGAGKTTLFRAIMGLIPSSAGRIDLDGSSLLTVPAHRIPALGIGFSPEDRRLFPTLPVRENLTLPLEAVGVEPAEKQRRLDAVYELLPELKALNDRKAGSLSGGQQKIVALGRALLLGTRLVLLDEPFQGLAPSLTRRYIQALVDSRVQNRDRTIVVAESNPRTIESLAQREFFIERGEVTSKRPQSAA